jgi:uncharacterized protein
MAMTVLLLSVGTTWAGPYEDGLAAYERGDYANALKIYRSLAAEGDSTAQNDLGFMYDEGKGVTKDYTEALRWYRLAAAQGHATAQKNLGRMYEEGKGAKQDYAEAIKWYRQAAEQGNAFAQIDLGLKYAQGQGVAQDNVRAQMWFILAVVSGRPRDVKHTTMFRDRFATLMTPQQIAQAQKMAGECQQRNFKGCD